MKKRFIYLLFMTAVLFIGSTKVYAGAIEDYLKDKPLGTIDTNSKSRTSFTKWENQSFKDYISIGAEGGDGPSFEAFYYTHNRLFDNVTNLRIVSSDENVLVAEQRPYDFSKEKKHYEEYIENFNATTFEEYIDEYESGVQCSKDDENGDRKYIGDDACRIEIEKQIEEWNKMGHSAPEYYTTKLLNFQKPTWWEYNEYEEEPDTWWKAYKLDAEPHNTVEVISYAKDLGSAYLTLSADGKEDIRIDWKLSARNFSGNQSDLLGEIINHYDRYEDFVSKEIIDGTTCNFVYYINDGDDLSAPINALKGKDLNICFVQYTSIGDANYILNGKEIKNEVTKGFNYNHKISMENSINKDRIDYLMEYKDAIFIDFTYHGALPTSYRLKVDIKDYIFNQYLDIYMEQFNCQKYNTETDEFWKEYSICRDKALDKAEEMKKDYLNNTEFTLLYYNPETNEMEIVKELLKTDENGIVELDFDHFSSYVLVANNNYQLRTLTEEDKKENNAQTGTLNVGLYSVLTFGSIGGIGYLIKKRKES